MAGTMAARSLLALAVLGAAANAAPGGGALLQTWENDLVAAGGKGRDTPITRVVKLLEGMSETLKKEMDEDESLNKQLGCWCNNNKYEKDQSTTASTAKISELEATIEAATAKSSELTTSISELEAELASDKNALAEATALRNKQLAEFQGMETDSIQALENLKAAITVLSKHQGSVKSTVEGGAVFKSEKDSWGFVQTGKDLPSWTEQHESNHMERSLSDFMDSHGFDASGDASAALAADRAAAKKSLRGDVAAFSQGSASDDVIVQRALKSAQAFMQAHHQEQYMPSYNSQSGEIFGVLNQLKEQMEGNLGEAQKEEANRAGAFAELREAKSAEISNGEKMAEQKEDELATTNNNLAEAKEDLKQEQAVLAEDTKFLATLTTTCAEADKNFAARKQARLDEITAVTQTINILQDDDARDAMSSTYNGAAFIQLSARRHRLSSKDARHKAALALRQVALKTKNPNLAVLATTVELDAFTKVKKAIDDMVATLRVQQADEVKKNDWCGSEIQSNEMNTAKTTDYKADLEAQKAQLESDVKTLEEGIFEAKTQISQLQLDLQRATEDRKAENKDFQTTVADQAAVVEVLKKALDKLATFYDSEFLQKSQKSAQTPPVPQMEYSKSAGSTGVMSMIEKLIQDAKSLMADSKKSEQESQAAYEATVASTNMSVDALSKEVVSKTKAQVKANKDKLETVSDISDTQKELDGLGKYSGELHAECDYVMKNFGARQEARAQEIEALQQAKQILSGASLQ
jgi:septal ring factor EnvC (AmiA/AmiB activator)